MEEKFKDLLLTDLWQDPNYELKKMPCPEVTIEGIDQSLYAKLLAQAASANAQFEGNKASIEGLEFDWNFDATAQVLHVTCTKKPFYVSCDRVQSEIQKLIEKARETI